jgi:hypothetical protein
MANVHIGKRIKEVLGQSHFTVVDFAVKINKTRTVVYDIFKRQSIDTGLLLKIGKVLDHDFFSVYSTEGNTKQFKDEKTAWLKKNDAISALTEELNAVKKQVAELEKKNTLLEKVIELMEEKRKGKAKTKPPVKK